MARAQNKYTRSLDHFVANTGSAHFLSPALLPNGFGSVPLDPLIARSNAWGSGGGNDNDSSLDWEADRAATLGRSANGGVFAGGKGLKGAPKLVGRGLGVVSSPVANSNALVKRANESAQAQTKKNKAKKQSSKDESRLESTGEDSSTKATVVKNPKYIPNPKYTPAASSKIVKPTTASGDDFAVTTSASSPQSSAATSPTSGGNALTAHNDGLRELYRKTKGEADAESLTRTVYTGSISIGTPPRSFLIDFDTG